MLSWWETLGETVKQQRVPTAPPLANTFFTVVVGGADPNMPRPTEAEAVYWKMDAGVTPVNAVTGDIIFNADA